MAAQYSAQGTPAFRPGGLHILRSRAEVAQSVERRTENPCVPSSILGLGTIKKEAAMRRLYFIIFVMVGIMGFTALTEAGVPRIINYQGKFTNQDDTPLAGNYLVTFRFYDVASEGKAAWEESHILTINNGIFNVLLGSLKPLDIDFNKDMWLGIEVSSDGEMTPRIKLASSAYAINAQTIDTLDSSQLMRNDIDAVLSGSLTVRKDLILKNDLPEPARIVLTDSKNQEYYMWMDDTGDLRIKQGKPASDKDGSIVIKEKDGRLSSSFIQSVTLLLLLVAILIMGLILYATKKK